MSKMNTIDLNTLATVTGGAGPQDKGYNAGDLVRGGAGALLGGLTGGPLGAVVGGGGGFMSRKVGELADGVTDLMRERDRGKQLDAQLKAVQQKRAGKP
jgi:hypothetical protein